MKIYVASSWRNEQHQQGTVALLRADGHEVYDFRHPAPDNDGFGWSRIDPDWLTWTRAQFRDALAHPIARDGFGFDMDALKWCDACVLVLPCGRSAHLELGYAVGAGKRSIVYAPTGRAFEPELMYRMCDAFVLDETELRRALLEVVRS